MFKKYRVLKWSLLSLSTLIILLLIFGFWFINLLPPVNKTLETTTTTNLPYLSKNIIPSRGKILAVVTSTDMMGTSGKSTGYELTELARAYYVFEANGFEVDVASPLGGKPPVVLDDDDMGSFDYAFLNDVEAQYKTSHTIPLGNVIAAEYEAIFFAGGKGAMFDFPENKSLQKIVRDYYESGKVVGAVCHGPAALVNVQLKNGRPLIENKSVSGFTNNEELLLIPDAETVFPFLLQDKIIAQGANFKEGNLYLENVSVDKNLVTGQNPWSTWSVAESMIRQMGYTPKYREATDEENAVTVLEVYENQGLEKAKDKLEMMLITEGKPVNRVLIATHSIVGVMKGEMGRFMDLVRLTSFAKKCDNR